MKSEVKHLPESRVRVSIKLDKEEFQKHYEHALGHFIDSVRIPGFRKGKAPNALVEKQVGPLAVIEEAIQHAVPDSYYEVVTKEKLHPLSAPQVTIEDTDDGLSFVAEVDVLPTVEIKDWRKVSLKPIESEKIDQKAVDKVIRHLQRERAELSEVDRPLQGGDFATISYTGSLGGVQQENMASIGHPLVVGEGTLIPGFEENLVGMKVGEEKSFDITFPTDYGASLHGKDGTASPKGHEHEKSLAKKKAKFNVTLDAMKELKLPVVDEAFATQFGKKDKADLESAIKEQLEQEAVSEAKRKTQEELLEKIVERTNADLPQSVIEAELTRIIDNFKERLQMDDMGFGLYLEKQNKTLEQMREEALPQAKKNAMVGLALGKIMEEFELNPNDKDAVEKTLEKVLEVVGK